MDCRLAWSDLWQAQPQCIQILIWAVYGILTSPADLQFCVKAYTSSCLLCPGKGTLKHIHSWLRALADGHYWCRLAEGSIREDHSASISIMLPIQICGSKASICQTLVTQRVWYRIIGFCSVAFFSLFCKMKPECWTGHFSPLHSQTETTVLKWIWGVTKELA